MKRSSPDSIDLERFLHNCTWVRRLACRLLYDESLTDDVMQEVYLALVQAPPSKPRVLNSWLGTVVRRLTSRVNYLQRRRQDFERVFPEESTSERVTPSAADIASRLETQGQLAQAVSRLPDAQREVVYLHFYEGLKLTEIALRLGTPPSTVRTQLSRALERLRATLARQMGGRSKMAGLLLPLLLPDDLLAHVGTGAAGAGLDSTVAHHSPVIESAQIRPVPVGPTRTRVAVLASLGAVAVLVLSVGGFLFRRTPDVSSAVAKRDEMRSEVSGRPVASQAGVAPSLPTATPESGLPRVALLPRTNLRVVDARTGAPVPEAAIYSVRRMRRTSPQVGATDADGAAFVDPEVLGRDSLLLLAPGFVERRERARLREVTEAPYVIELEPKSLTTLRVRTTEGDAAAGIGVTVRPRLRGLEDPEPLELVTDAAGEATYAFRYLQTAIEIDAEGFATVATAATTPVQVVELVRGTPLGGRVLDADGEAVAACRVKTTSSRRSQPRVSFSDDEGRFSLGNVTAGEEMTVRLWHPDFPAYQQVGIAPESALWDFQLPDGVVVTGSVNAPDDSPAAGATVFLMQPEPTKEESGRSGTISGLNTAGLPRQERRSRRLLPLGRTRVQADGTFAVGPVGVPEGGAYLFVHDARWENALQRIDDFDEPRDIQLRQGATLRGRLVSPLGEPIAGATLHVGEVWSNEVEGIVTRVRTAADGAFTLVGLPVTVEERLQVDNGKEEEVYRSIVFLTAFAPDELFSLGDLSVEDSRVPGGFTLAAAIETLDPLELVGAKRGAGVAVELRLEDLDGFPVRTWTRVVAFGADGQASAGALGRHLREPRFFPASSVDLPEPDWSRVFIAPDEYRWQELDLSGEGDSPVTIQLESVVPATVRFRLARPDGAAVSGRDVFVQVPFGALTPLGAVVLGTTDSSGTVDVSSLPAGRYDFLVAPVREVAPRESGEFTAGADLPLGADRAAIPQRA